MIWPAWAAAASAFLTGVVGVELVPDARLYATTGLGLYPSPLGSLLGWLGGYTALVIAQALGVGIIVGVLAYRHVRGSAVVGVVLLSPWLIPLGVDAIAAAALLLWLLKGSGVLGVVAAGLHLALLPIVVLVYLRSRGSWLLASVLGLGGVAVALLTPYGWGGFRLEAVLAAGLIAGLVTVLASSGVGPTSRWPMWPVVVGTFSAALVGATADLNEGASYTLAFFAATRYGLPLALVVAVATVLDGRAERPKTAPGKAVAT